MFVCNLKINGKKIWKVCLVILSILIVNAIINMLMRKKALNHIFSHLKITAY